MRRLIILMIMVLSLANSSIIIKSGWQLVGLDSDISDMSIFDKDSVSQVWTYNASTQKWSGYSPNSDTLNKISKTYTTISKIDRWQGVWIKSTKEWQLDISNSSKLDTPIDTISLKEGWNLISIPINSTLSPKVFSDEIVWKYSDNNWSMFENNSTISFGKIENIRSSDGIWVKVDKDKKIDISKESASLSSFENYNDMVAYIKDMIVEPLYYDIEAPLMVNSEAVSKDVSNTTNTNLQESGVDESDIIKNDGKKVYYLDKDSNSIYIREFKELVDNSPYITSQIKLQHRPDSFYIYKDKLILLSSGYNGIPQIVVDIYYTDTLILKESFVVDGYIINSRLLDNRLILISSFTPNNQDNRLIPQLKSSTYNGDLISYNTLYAPYNKNQESTISSISSFNLDDLKFEDSISIIGYSDTIYASTNSLYIISSKYPIYYNFNDYQSRSVIYKFNIKDNLSFQAQGFVDGKVLNQFSISEYNSTLRVATTEGFSWSSSGTKNSIFTLSQNRDKLENIGYLGSLGEESEVIKSVRFIEDKAYLVTFKQSDPLYTIDLSDIKNPKKVGELKIEGFSSYIHIVDNNRLLTVGQNADESGTSTGLMLELFDISDFSNPKLTSKVLIGDNNYYSPALNNHKAFIYRESDKLFGIPYKDYQDNKSNYFGLYLVDGDNIIKKQTIYNYKESCNDTRGVIFDYENISYISSLCGDTLITQKILKDN